MQHEAWLSIRGLGASQPAARTKEMPKSAVAEESSLGPIAEPKVPTPKPQMKKEHMVGGSKAAVVEPVGPEPRAMERSHKVVGLASAGASQPANRTKEVPKKSAVAEESSTPIAEPKMPTPKQQMKVTQPSGPMHQPPALPLSVTSASVCQSLSEKVDINHGTASFPSAPPIQSLDENMDVDIVPCSPQHKTPVPPSPADSALDEVLPWSVRHGRRSIRLGEPVGSGEANLDESEDDPPLLVARERRKERAGRDEGKKGRQLGTPTGKLHATPCTHCARKDIDYQEDQALGSCVACRDGKLKCTYARVRGKHVARMLAATKDAGSGRTSHKKGRKSMVTVPDSDGERQSEAPGPASHEPGLASRDLKPAGSNIAMPGQSAAKTLGAALHNLDYLKSMTNVDIMVCIENKMNQIIDHLDSFQETMG